MALASTHVLTLTRSATTLRLLAGMQLFMISMLSRMKTQRHNSGALPYTRVWLCSAVQRQRPAALLESLAAARHSTPALVLSAMWYVLSCHVDGACDLITVP